MSNRHSYNLTPHKFTMDDCAAYDFPAALETMRKQIGDRRIHVICHCLGSMSFMMSLAAKKVKVASVIANSVALTPRAPGWSVLKGGAFPFMIDYLLDFTYVSPRWADDPRTTRGKLMSKMVSQFHRECDVPACHMLSLMWGTGWPALYEHENLHEVTHRRGGDLYGGTSLNYHRHVYKMMRAKNRALKMDTKEPRFADMPDDYVEAGKEIDTPVLFMTGRNNRVFTDSNILCHEILNQASPGLHELHIFDGYGHQDVFMGKSNDVDIFPRLVQWMDTHGKARDAVASVAE